VDPATRVKDPEALVPGIAKNHDLENTESYHTQLRVLPDGHHIPMVRGSVLPPLNVRESPSVVLRALQHLPNADPTIEKQSLELP
jgi:hypothetical protein